MNHISSRGVFAYGLSIGVMLCDSTYPAFPGDVKNPSAYSFPIQYDVIEGMRWETLVNGSDEDRAVCLNAVIASAKRLERLGCKAIVAECGFFFHYQKEIVKHVNIPVFMSSLLQLPFIQNTIPENKSIGIVCASRKSLEENMEILYDLGLNRNRTVHLFDELEEHFCTQFYSLWYREDTEEVAECKFAEAQEDMIILCKKFYETYPDLGTLLFECTGYQPFANAVQEQLNLPIYSWGTMLEYINSAVVHRKYNGSV